MIIETIVTTVAADGTLNCAPMGVEWGDERIVLTPFVATQTFRNLRDAGTAVINLTDDVELFARAAISNAQPPTTPAVAIPGAVLADCCAWREVRVSTLDAAPPRARIDAHVVHRESRRDFIGFCRAHHAVLEAAIYTTRLHLLDRAFVAREFDRLQVLVDKTAGPRERTAMALLREYFHAAGQAEDETLR